MFYWIKNNYRRINDLIKYLKLFRRRSEISFIQNKNIKQKQAEDEFYREMEKRFMDLISQGVIPAASESKQNNKVFICWLQGEDNMPPLVKACLNSVRKNMPDKEVVVLSEKTIPEYVTLPNYIWEKRNQGMISHAHFSDLVRISLLCEHGGVWCDATVLCTETPPKLMTDEKLFVFKAMDLSRKDYNPTICSNWYISAWSNQRILVLTRELLYEYWKTADSIGNYFAFHIFLAMAAKRYPEDWKAIPFYNNHSPHTLQFEFAEPFTEERWEQITGFSPIHKLNHHIKYEDNGSFYSYVIHEYGKTE